MKNNLEYYYNIKIDKIHQTKGKYYFIMGDFKYHIIEYNNSLEELSKTIKLSEDLKKYGIYTHKILENIENNYVTKIENKFYILMVSYLYLDKKATYNDILEFNKLYIPVKNNLNWKNLWSAKMDYFEYQINQFGDKYPLLKESFPYFSGYVETAISFLNEFDFEINSYISHKRIDRDSTLYDLYNPFNIVIDSRSRDMSEYFKSFMFEGKITYEKILNDMILNNFNNEEIILFFVRMMYPTLYFDTFENVINNDSNDEQIKKVLENTLKYENMVKKIYMNIKTFINIPTIEWLLN